MKKLLPLCFLLTLLVLSNNIQAQCNGCEVLICDGVECDDGTPADGVQTSRNCSCGKEIGGACAYVEVFLGGNIYYDPDDPKCELIFNTQESGNYSIYVSDSDCFISDCADPDFVITSGGTISGFPSSGEFSLVICKNGGNAGRRDFNFSVSCSTIENCVNGVDDNKDGLVDCDDGSCATDFNCDYTSTSSGMEGGLESNNRLAQKIANRNFNRVKSGENFSFKKSDVLTEKGLRNNNEKNNIQLLDFFPVEAIKSAQSFLSSPENLVNITNAEELASIDYYINDNRIATIFGTKTLTQIYEHSKFICDRLNGSKILEVWNYKLDGVNDFIVAKFSSEKGEIEYNTNFSIKKESDTNFSLESHWNIADYPEGDIFYNFQIWSNNMNDLETLVKEVLLKIENKGKVIAYNMGRSAGLYVSEINFEQGILELELHNQDSSSDVTIEGSYSLSETLDSEDFVYNTKLTSAKKEVIQIPAYEMYDLGVGLFTDKDTVYDAIYVADGSWGLDYDETQTEIHQFEVMKEARDIQEGSFKINRDVHLTAHRAGKIQVFRSLSPSYRAKNLDNFNHLQGQVKGAGDLLITLVKENIQEWSQHPRYRLKLTGDVQNLNISKKLFYSDLGDQDWKDIKMIVFEFNSNANDVYTSNVEFEISGLKFSKLKLQEDIPDEDREVSVFPNPFHDFARLQFFTDQSQRYNFTLTDVSGKLIQEFSSNTTKGRNQIDLVNQNYDPGLYVYTILLDSGFSINGKIVIAGI